MPLPFDAIGEGDALPSVTRLPSTHKVLQFCGATWMWVQQFYDHEFARRGGLEGPVIPGPLYIAYLQGYLNQWLDGAGTLRRFQVSYRRASYHNVELTLGGTVTRKHEQDSVSLLDLELWIDNARGERSVRGSASVAFASSRATSR